MDNMTTSEEFSKEFTKLGKEAVELYATILDFLKNKDRNNVSEPDDSLTIQWVVFQNIVWHIQIKQVFNGEGQHLLVEMRRNEQIYLKVRYTGSPNKIFDHIITAVR